MVGEIYVHTQNNAHDKIKLQKCQTAITLLRELGIAEPHVYTALQRIQIIEKHDMLQNLAEQFEAEKKSQYDEFQQLKEESCTLYEFENWQVGDLRQKSQEVANELHSVA